MSTRPENLIKAENLQTLYQTMMRVRQATIPQLAELTGLSVVTVAALIKSLLEEGKIQKDAVVQSAIGRPAVSYRFHEQFHLVLTICMHEEDGCDTVFFNVCNLYGEFLQRLKKPFDDITVSTLENSICPILEQFPAIGVIGFGFPGEEVHGRLLVSDYPGLQNAELRALLQQRFGLPVVIENDVNAAAYGYYYKHGKKEACIVGLYFPRKYPPGAGVCLHGQVLKGRDGLAGEIQYIPFDGEDESARIVSLVKTYICLSNPNTIVLYQDAIDKRLPERIKEQCTSEIERMMLPEIVLSDRLHGDFETGIFYLALHHLDPVLA